MTPRGLLVKVGSLLRAERADGAENQELDAALAALEAALPDAAERELAIDLSRYRSVLPMAPRDQSGADAEYALARFGACVVRDWFRRTSGFQAADGFQLDEGALGTGVVTRGATVGYRHAPGIADAVARLLKEESHA